MTGKTLRLINFLIDTAIYFVFMIVFIILFKNEIAQENVKWISILVYFLYYFLFEFAKGQTPGKIITRSKAVSITENNKYFFIQILIRTFIRFLLLTNYNTVSKILRIKQNNKKRYANN